MRPANVRLEIDPKFQPVMAALKLTTWDAIVDHFSRPPAPRKTRVVVIPASMGHSGGPALEVFFKLYHYRRPSWSFLGRRSKARREYENYDIFRQLEIPCAERIAWGERRDAVGRLRQAFILTRAVPQAMTLIELFKAQAATPPHSRNREHRKAVLSQLGLLARRLHQHHFYHHDLVWRNILVTTRPPDPPQLWCIDCPRGRFDHGSPWRRRRQLRDLSSLDKSAALFCSRTERLHLLKTYLGQDQVTPELKEWARKILHYRLTRWPGQPSIRGLMPRTRQ